MKLKVITEMLKGKNPNDEKKKLSAETSFGELFSMYMERYSKHHKKTWRSDERDVPKILRSLVSEKAIKYYEAGDSSAS